MEDIMKKSVLVTGCSTGIGRATILKLKEQGYYVIATVRDEKSKTELESLGITVVLMDLNDETSIIQGIELIQRLTNASILALINNAGYAQLGSIEDLSTELLRQQFETNVFGLITLTRLCLPMLRHNDQSWIINISSINGYFSLPFFGAYCGSKFALEALTSALRAELKLRNDLIEVVNLNPGPIATNFVNTMNKFVNEPCFSASLYKIYYEKIVNLPKRLGEIHPDKIADKICFILNNKKNKAYYIIPFTYKLLLCLYKLIPKRLESAVFKMVGAKIMKNKK